MFTHTSSVSNFATTELSFHDQNGQCDNCEWAAQWLEHAGAYIPEYK